MHRAYFFVSDTWITDFPLLGNVMDFAHSLLNCFLHLLLDLRKFTYHNFQKEMNYFEWFYLYKPGVRHQRSYYTHECLQHMKI
jgi:hypothetical protein